MDSDYKGRKKKIIEKPHYLGGSKAIKEFILKNLKYPQKAVKNKIEGQVHCRYKLNHKGKVIDVQILSGLGYGCDEEAIRLLKLMSFEPPKIPKKVKAFFFKNIRIHFRLPKQKPTSSQAPSFSYTYKIKPSKKAEERVKQTSYYYSLNIKEN